MSSCWPPPPKSAEAGEAHPAFGADLRRIGRRGSSRPVLIVVATLFTRVRLQGFFNAIGRFALFTTPSRHDRYLRICVVFSVQRSPRLFQDVFTPLPQASRVGRVAPASSAGQTSD
jgi:hypothetical protein